MTDITSSLSQIVQKSNAPIGLPGALGATKLSVAQITDEFLKEAYKINSHISSLLSYLRSTRHSYLSTAPPPRRSTGTATTSTSEHLTDQERDEIDSSTAILLRHLSGSIANLSSAESVRQETELTLLRKKYPSRNNVLWRWAAGGEDAESEASARSAEQKWEEESARMKRTVREGVLWFLRRRLETAAEIQREMVEKRVEREREKEKSVLYKMNASVAARAGVSSATRHDPIGDDAVSKSTEPDAGAGNVSYRGSSAIGYEEAAEIESQLSPEQLQLFAQENDSMLKHYEDTLSKVQNAEKSLLEISSLQQTLVGHLATQEDYINQLVTDAESTHTNVGRGNKELKRAAERRSTAQAVFWGTVGLCTWLVVWDAIF